MGGGRSAAVGGMCRLGGMRRWASEERVGVGGEGGGRESDMFGPGDGGGCGAVVRCGGAGWGMLVWAEDGAVWVGKKGVE